ncbi:hypothetical protein [Nocardia sp. BMG51109]|uniref:LppU family putative lipoprotein n=1 Tax=Nocardia sp. BMG51109 TaxID=1056816 RepID=UPI000465A892|nr:hypothetical protein [Nocardia sp. BMG51109]
MSRRRIHAGFTLAGFVIAAALSAACLAAAVLSLTGDDEPAPGRAQAAGTASPVATVPPTTMDQPLPAVSGTPDTPAPEGPEPPPMINKDAALHKDPAAIEVNVGDCVVFGAPDTPVSKATCGSPGAGYKVVDKAGPDRRCPTDVDRSYTDAAPGSPALCLDINWVVGSCMDVAPDAPKPIACGATGRQPVRVVEIKQGTANVNECSSGNRGFVYNQRRFVVCVAST